MEKWTVADIPSQAGNPGGRDRSQQRNRSAHGVSAVTSPAHAGPTHCSSVFTRTRSSPSLRREERLVPRIRDELFPALKALHRSKGA